VRILVNILLHLLLLGAKNLKIFLAKIIEERVLVLQFINSILQFSTCLLKSGYFCIFECLNRCLDTWILTWEWSQRILSHRLGMIASSLCSNCSLLILLFQFCGKELFNTFTIALSPILLSNCHSFFNFGALFIQLSYLLLLKIQQFLKMLILFCHLSRLAFCLQSLNSHFLNFVNHFWNLTIQLWLRSVFQFVFIFTPRVCLNL